MTDVSALARAMHGLIEPLHAILYFAPEAAEEYEAIGLEPVAQGYVAGRAAPMGAVGPGAAHAAFHNFSRSVIDLGLPGAWEIASPEEVIAARSRAVERFFTRIDAPTDGLEEATELARRARRSADLTGRPLAAGNADVPAPSGVFAALWQALGVLREHRGDGHVALLTAAGVGPVEALVLHAAWQTKASRSFLQSTRLWDDDAWARAEEGLRSRDWLDADGRPTDAGRAWRDQIEAETDRLASGPYAAVGVDATRRLFTLLEPLAGALRDADAYPGGFDLPELPDVA